MKKMLPFVLILAACSAPQPEPEVVQPPVERELTAKEWKQKACIGVGTPCAEKPQGIPQTHSKARLAAAPRFVAGSDVEGYGKGATGGANLCVVTNQAATGAGSFSACARQSNVNVVFNGPGPFTVDGQQTYLGSNVTIDGCANGQNGVTLAQPSDRYRAVVVEGGSNYVFRCLRFQGEGKPNSSATEHDLLALDGTDSPVSNVLVDLCTFIKGSDGALDITGNTTDVTVQRSLLYGNALTMLIKYGNRARLSIHHNVLTGNCERNPQIKGALDGFDWVNNVSGPEASPPIIDGGNGLPFKDCYEMRCWTGSDSPGNPLGNIINNAFFGQNPWTVEGVPGVYAAGNLGGGTAPRPAPYPIPSAFSITTHQVDALKALVPTWGAPNKTSEDVAAIQRVLALLPGSGGPTPSPTPTAMPTPPIPTPSPTATPTPPGPTPSPTASPTPGPTPLPTPAPGTPPVVVSTTCGSKVTTTPLGDSLRLNFRWQFWSGSCVVVVK